METFAEKIRYYREKANMSKSELARQLYVSPAYVTMLEKGDKTNPSFNLIFKISEVLNIPYSELPIIEFQQDKNLADSVEEETRKIKNRIKYNSKNSKIRKATKNNMNSVLISNKFVQNSLLYNYVLSILISKYYTDSIEELINKLKFDNVEQLAAKIVNDTGKYIFSNVNASLNSLKENPEDLSFNVEALNSEIEVYNEYFSSDIKAMVYAENNDIHNS
jgi:transcriptional regulator with XRE-family HTH domain